MKLVDIYNIQQEKRKEKKVIVEIPAVSSLIKHLDLLYSIVINNQIREQQKDEIQQISWFNNGQGSKDQSDSVN
tara:strand:+ start:354 stop:575 length:222 start_codon:yes stop_codon:yes gene_type:complete